MQKSKQLAKTYAQALLETCKNDIALQEILLNEIVVIEDAISQIKNAKDVFESPIISNTEKKELIKKVFSGKVNERILNFLFILIDNYRFNTLKEIQDQLTKIVNKSKKIAIAEVHSVSELDKDTLENLTKVLENVLPQGEKVTIESKISPELIGGVKVKINDLVYDGSIKGRLENIKQKLEV